MNQKSQVPSYAAGLAIFSMFFGAGNIIYPLALGYETLQNTPYAIMGLLLTAVIIPFAGLFAMFLYQGHTQEFFGRIGQKPGLMLAFFIIALLGPFGSTPRCIALAYSTFKLSFPGTSALLFSGLSCVLIFFCAYRKNRLLDLLGYVLTPALVALLLFLIAKGFWDAPAVSLQNVHYSHLDALFHGLKEGYNTMDLLAAFFFAPLVLSAIQRKANLSESDPALFKLVLKASCIGALMLAIVYVGFSYLAYFYAPHIGEVSSDQLLAVIALSVAGPYAGMIVGVIVVLACLTTAIALIAAFTSFVYKDIYAERIPENFILVASLGLTFFIATFEFNGISQFLNPILQMCYPALILLTALNLGTKWLKRRAVYEHK